MATERTSHALAEATDQPVRPGRDVGHQLWSRTGSPLTRPFASMSARSLAPVGLVAGGAFDAVVVALVGLVGLGLEPFLDVSVGLAVLVGLAVGFSLGSEV